MSDVKVFVSYSWRIHESVKVVDDLEVPARERSIRLLRDKKEIKLGEYIREFMQKIADAEHVAVVLSKPYFESEYCLWELLKLYERRRDDRTIYPVLVDDIDLSKSSSIIDFWKSKRDELQQEIDNDGAGNVPDKADQLNLYENLVINVDSLMKWAGGILAEQAKSCKENDFSNLLDLIREIPKVPPGSIFQPSKPDAVFIKDIESRLKLALDGSDTLRKAIAAQLEIEGLGEQSDKLSQSLISSCCEESIEDLLRDDIFLAVESALHNLSSREDNDSPQTRKEVDQLTGSADSLFSCLLLFAIRDSWMEEYCKGCRVAGSNLRQVPFNASAVIEVVTSRHLQRLPQFELTATEAVGLEGIAALEHGFEQDDVVTGLLRQVWIKVFPTDLASNFQGTEHQMRKLGSQIKNRHRRKVTSKNNYYCIVPNDASHDLANPDIRAEIMKNLPELPLIILHAEGGEDALLIPDDYDLASLIFDFYQLLNEYRPYEPAKNNRRPEEN